MCECIYIKYISNTFYIVLLRRGLNLVDVTFSSPMRSPDLVICCNGSVHMRSADKEMVCSVSLTGRKHIDWGEWKCLGSI